MSGTETADFVIIGGGVIGCSTAYHLASLAAGRVVLLERGSVGSGGTGKSCAIVRTHYSVKANLVHAVESLKVFSNFQDVVGGEAGFRRTGYLILGPEAHREPMLEVFRNQNEYSIDTRILSPDEAREIHPLLRYDDVGVIGYDTQAGYCDPHQTTVTYARRARELGAEIRTETPVTGLQMHGNHKIVQTPEARIESPIVLIAAGPWTGQIVRWIGLELPYEVSRHKVITLKTDQPYRLDWPIVKDLTTPDKIYFRSETGGVVLVGTGDHGDPIEDPDILTDHIDREHVERIERLISHRMPAFADAQYVAGWTGPYDITPDWNPVVGSVPEAEGIFVAVGFSGHGFKLAPTIGESLARTMAGLEPRVPIEAYALERFRAGAPLQGAYGIGSIS